jgi:hypothetical protein
MMHTTAAGAFSQARSRPKQQFAPVLFLCLLAGLSLGVLKGCASDSNVYYYGGVYMGYGYYDPWYWRHYWYRPPYWGPPGYRPPGYRPPRPEHPIAQPRIQNPVTRPAAPAARPTVKPFQPTSRPAQQPNNRAAARPTTGNFRAGPPRGMSRPMGGMRRR